MDNIAVSISNLTVRIKDKVILSELSLEVKEGAFHGIFGPNGAGKTVLFTTLQGALKPTEGEVSVLGANPYPRDTALLRRIGIQRQRPTFFPKMTLYEHLGVVASIHRAPRSRIDDLIGALKLDDAASTRIADLSGGERRRLAIATAVVHRPRLLFLDEPTASLDVESRRDLVRLLKDNRLARTVLYATHHLDEASRLCNVVSILNGRRILITARPNELIARAELESTILLPNAPRQIDLVWRLVGRERVRATAYGLEIRTRDAGATFAELRGFGVDTSHAQVRGERFEDAYLHFVGMDGAE